MKRIRFAWDAASTEWVTIKMVCPASFILENARSSSEEDWESKAPVGSSASKRAGLEASALAMDTR